MAHIPIKPEEDRQKKVCKLYLIDEKMKTGNYPYLVLLTAERNLKKCGKELR